MAMLASVTVSIGLDTKGDLSLIFFVMYVSIKGSLTRSSAVACGNKMQSSYVKAMCASAAPHVVNAQHHARAGS